MEMSPLLVTLRDLEQRLLLPEVRADPLQLGLLLHPDFVEVGASGEIYTRDEVLAEFEQSPPSYAVWAQDFEAHPVVEGVALLRYRSAHIDESGQLSRFVARTTLWQRNGGSWQARFHQGTPTGAFDKQAT